MIHLYKKEISQFFNTITGPLIICLFLIINGILLWSEYSPFNLLDNTYASLNSLFFLSPLLFILFVSALCMKIFSDEFNLGTIEILLTKPISITKIVLSKLLAVYTIVFFAILISYVNVISLSQISVNPENFDNSIILSSYLGLLLITFVFVSLSILSSSIINNQIICLILSVLISSIFYLGFDLISNINILYNWNSLVKKIGISYHYQIICQGLLKLSSIIYFLFIGITCIFFSTLVINNKTK